MNRTVTMQITFGRPFQLPGIDEVQPAGTYTIETEEELLQALSFVAWRRLYTVIRLPRRAGGPMIDQAVTIDPDTFEAVIALDTAAGTPH